MNILLMPAISTIIAILMGLFDKTYKYIIYFIFMLGLNYSCHGNEIKIPDIKNIESKHLQNYRCFPDKPLTEEEKNEYRYYKEKNWQRFLDGMHWLEHEASMIPDIDIQDEILIAIEGISGGILAKNITLGAVTAVIIIFRDYVEGVYINWKAMKWKMDDIEADLEMYFFYDKILIKNAEIFPNA